jgi:hypothetical protein
MRLPRNSASSGLLVELAWFLICALHADVDDVGEDAAKGVSHARAALKTRMAHRNQAADDLIAARAGRRVARHRVARWLKQLGLDTTAAFGGNKKALGYQLILPMAPSTMMGQGTVARMESLGKVLKALAHPDTPAGLQAQAALGHKLIQALVQHEVKVQAAEAVVGECVHEIAIAREDWFTAYKSQEAALTLKFPTDAERVDSYFDAPPTTKAKATPETVEAAKDGEKA